MLNWGFGSDIEYGRGKVGLGELKSPEFVAGGVGGRGYWAGTIALAVLKYSAADMIVLALSSWNADEYL